MSRRYDTVGTVVWVLGILCPAWFNEGKSPIVFFGGWHLSIRPMSYNT